MAVVRSEQDAMAAKLAAERAAREAEEARRRDIMEKIQLLEDEINECQGLISSFSGLKGQVGMLISRMNEYKAMNLEADRNSFFGMTASAVYEGMTSARSAMGESAGSFSEVESAIGSQIGMLSSYVMELRSRISSLQAGL